MLPNYRPTSSPIRLGFVPLNDCAPIAVAKECGLFEKYGIHVKLTRQIGWASVRDMFCYNQLDAAHSIAGLALSLSLGLQSQKCEVAVPLYLSCEGNAITLSTNIAKDATSHGHALREYAKDHLKGTRPLTFAATHVCSSHHFLLLQWLKQRGMNCENDQIQIVFLPPPVMSDALQAGYIDGFCAGEPWNTVACENGVGWSAASSAGICFGHPEKALICSSAFIYERKEEMLLLSAALLDACKLCQDPDFFKDMIAILSRPSYLSVDVSILEKSFRIHQRLGDGGAGQSLVCHFHGGEINRPDSAKSSWLLSGFRASGLLGEKSLGSLTKVFREDLYQIALQMSGA